MVLGRHLNLSGLGVCVGVEAAVGKVPRPTRITGDDET